MRILITAAAQIIKAGVNLHGYLVGRLMNDFEWAEGYAPCFCLVYVDYTVQDRFPQKSFH